MNGISSSRKAWRGLPAFFASMSASSSAFSSILSASLRSAAARSPGGVAAQPGQRLARGGYRRVDVLDRRLRHLRHRLGGRGIQDFQSHASTSVTVSIRLPRRSSSGKSASGSMHCSGGSAPRASTAPRASSLTAAAAGAAVETMPPPRPHSSCGGVKDVTRAVRPARVRLDDVRGHGLRGRGQRSRGHVGALRLSCRGELAQALEQGGREREAEARLAASEAAGKRAHLGVDRVDRLAVADRVGEAHRRRPARAARARPAHRRGSRPAASSVRRSASGARTGSSLRPGASRSRPPAATCTASSFSAPSTRAACARHDVRLARARAHPEDREQAGALEVVVELELLAGHPVEAAEVDVVRPGVEARAHRVEVDPVAGRVHDDVGARDAVRHLTPCHRRDAPSSRAPCPGRGRRAGAARPRPTRPGRARSRARSCRRHRGSRRAS